jgi:Asp-tRNA(Asn)/Glu-tRNA(Gln) amidotransferase A subunit family amidase
VLLAKTATGELAWGDVWFNGITTRNPWNINTGSCGSSAGSAVAVAAGAGR